MIVRLVGGEIEMAKTLGRMRAAWFTDRNMQKHYNGADLVEDNVRAVMAEFAFCKEYNCFPAMTNDIGAEDAIYGDYSVDVKCTRRSDRALIVPDYCAQKPADWYVCAYVNYTNEVELIGMMRGVDVFKPENWNDALPRPGYMVSREKLDRMPGEDDE